MAFTLQERLQLGIHGLLPPCFLSQDVQVLRVMKNYENKSNDLDKYVKNILFPPSFPLNLQFFKDLKRTWGCCFKACRFPSESLFFHLSIPGVFILACCHLSYMLSWSHNSTSVCYSTTILLESSDVNLGVHWFTVLCVQKHNKKAAHAPEHWSGLVCCMHQSVCSQHIHLNTEQKSRKSLPTGRKKYNTRTMLYIDIFVFCFSDMEFSYPVFSDLVVEDEG